MESSTIGVAWPEFNDGLDYTDNYNKSSSESDSLIGFYSANYKSSAPTQGWLQRIRNGQITVNHQIVTDPNTILTIGSKLVYHRLPWKEPDAPFLIQVLYEDDHLVAFNKPSGLQVLPGGLFQQRTLLTQLQWTRRYQYAVPVHRLGRGTSGILLCAKTKLSKQTLASYFANGSILHQNKSNPRQISKIYRALVTGIIQQNQVVIKQPIGLITYPGVAQGLYVASSSGKPSLSQVTVLERNIQANNSLVQVEIQSGRPHQIRIHLSYIGHPLQGDPLYVAGGHPDNCFSSGSASANCAQDGGYERPVNAVPGDCGYYLHAHQVVLQHPATTEIIKITAPLPPVLEGKAVASFIQ
ncbi:hypothetical protein ACHQM5_010037 [Ranunculus cassubicifolius]